MEATHTAHSQAEERTDLARVPILPGVHQTRKGPIWRRWLFFLRGLLGWDPTTMMEEEKKQETLDPHCETLPG